MEQEGIIRPCPETTEWVHNIVTVVKKDGSVRLCLDHLVLIQETWTSTWSAMFTTLRRGRMLFTVSKMACTSPPWTRKVATGLKTLMNRVNVSLHLTHPFRNTALCTYPLGSQLHLKSSVKKWIRFFLVSLAHFPVQLMLKCKGPQKNVTTFTCWKWLSEHAKQGWNLTQISAASRNRKLSTLDVSSLHRA